LIEKWRVDLWAKRRRHAVVERIEPTVFKRGGRNLSISLCEGGIGKTLQQKRVDS